MCDLLGAISAVFSSSCSGNNSFSFSIVESIAIDSRQLFRCLHSPAGTVALLGVISK